MGLEKSESSLDPSLLDGHPILELSRSVRDLRNRGFGQRQVIPGRSFGQSSFDQYRPLRDSAMNPFFGLGFPGAFGYLGEAPDFGNMRSLMGLLPFPFIFDSVPWLQDTELPPAYQLPPSGGGGNTGSLNVLEVKWVRIADYNPLDTYRWTYDILEVDPVTLDDIANGIDLTTINIGEIGNTSDVVSPGVQVAQLLEVGFTPLPLGVPYGESAPYDGNCFRAYRLATTLVGADTYEWVLYDMTNVGGECPDTEPDIDEGTF